MIFASIGEANSCSALCRFRRMRHQVFPSAQLLNNYLRLRATHLLDQNLVSTAVEASYYAYSRVAMATTHSSADNHCHHPPRHPPDCTAPPPPFSRHMGTLRTSTVVRIAAGARQ
ncbi:hypothetical protein J6590_050325 [Homalodisca vitripennis]|nr:hypothetical protein J6590_050325 [Homalodisca vitripennis]